MSRKSPLPLADVLNYLRLEDAEGLVPGSVKYVGSVIEAGRDVHYWSYPAGNKLQWASWDGRSLGDAELVPPSIRASTLPLELHRTKKSPLSPKRPWVGASLTESSLPRWVPTGHVRMIDATFVAAFPHDFEKALAVFSAKPTTDKYNGGAGPCRYVFLEISRNRLAMLECEDRHPDRIDLYLPDRNGTVYWEDYDQVMNALAVPLAGAFRQGGINWKHRKSTPGAIERTRDHYKKMWMITGMIHVEV